MYVDELMTQKSYLDEIICDITRMYRNGSYGYRMELDMEHDAEGAGILLPDRWDSSYGKEMDAVKAMRILFFLLCEKERMAEAVSKCQKENNREIVKIYMQENPRISPFGGYSSGADRVSALYAWLSERKEIQKAKSGYDIIVTKTSKMDKALVDALYRKCSQGYESFQIEKEECGKIEVDYEPAIDYTQYRKMGLDAFLCELEEKGAITDGKEK